MEDHNWRFFGSGHGDSHNASCASQDHSVITLPSLTYELRNRTTLLDSTVHGAVPEVCVIKPVNRDAEVLTFKTFCLAIALRLDNQETVHKN